MFISGGAKFGPLYACADPEKSVEWVGVGS